MTDEDYEAIAERRTQALVASLKQTKDEVKAKMRAKNPDLPGEFVDACVEYVWQNTWFD